MFITALVEGQTRDFELLRECYIARKKLNTGRFAECELIANEWHHDNPICAWCKSIIDRAERSWEHAQG